MGRRHHRRGQENGIEQYSLSLDYFMGEAQKRKVDLMSNHTSVDQ